MSLKFNNTIKYFVLTKIKLNIKNLSAYWFVNGSILNCFSFISYLKIKKELQLKINCRATMLLIKNLLFLNYIITKGIKKFNLTKNYLNTR